MLLLVATGPRFEALFEGFKVDQMQQRRGSFEQSALLDGSEAFESMRQLYYRTIYELF